jgi:hypothetical protein
MPSILVELGAMFTIKSLFYCTAVVASLLLMLRETNGPTSAGAFGLLMYLALVVWFIYDHRNDGKEIMPEKNDGEKRAD